MGLMDKIFDRDDENEKKRKAAAPPTSTPRSDAPRADFSDVSGASSTTAPNTGAASAARRTYTVAAGDSLSKIAQREYGDASKWRTIYEANRDSIKDPDLIHPGQVLDLPPNS